MKITNLFSFTLGTVVASVVFILLSQFGINLPWTKMQSQQQPQVVEKIVYECPPDPRAEKFPPPKITPDTTLPYETNREGEVKISWVTIPNATTYAVKLYNLKGKHVRTWKSSKGTIYLKQIPFDDNLEFTPYRITLSTININGEAGAESEFYELKSRRLKNILAPKIEGITVED